MKALLCAGVVSAQGGRVAKFIQRIGDRGVDGPEAAWLELFLDNNVSNVHERNRIFAADVIDREDLWPKIVEYEQRPRTFRFMFGLDRLPEDPGVILIRGPRQFGKSTWLELQLRDTLQEYGPGSTTC